MRLFSRILALILVLLLMVLIGGYLYLRSSLPQTTGIITLAGLDGQVEIVRDGGAVPHIFASTDRDAFFAQGYLHAQDRMWQLEFQRRVGAGRLSEVLGEVTLDADQFLRTLGVYRAAKESWKVLDQKAQEALQAYADGVNAWLEQGHTLPPEFLILGVEPEPWTVFDSLVWAKMMSWDLGGNYRDELLRLQLVQAIGAERASELMPPYPEDALTILAANQIPAETAELLLSLDSYLESELQLGGLDVGSNNWVIAGEYTESGMPVLVNDPHLAGQIPAIWYLVELQGHKLHATGASLPGLPGVVLGHNEKIAWGMTNLASDVQDLYMERINPKDNNQYEVDGEWVDMTIVEEPIYVDGQELPILWAARSTRHGPLISDVSSNTPSAVAMRWTSLAPNETTFQAFLNINYASNWAEFKNTFKKFIAPTQNFVYADQEGNIGYFGPGYIPIRAQGDGTIPVPGWNSEYEWIGWIPFDELPQAYNPATGFIVTANNRVVSNDYPYFISHDWATPHRAQRIVELIEKFLANGDKISVADMAMMQADRQSTQAEELLPFLLEVTPANERQIEALAFLKKWDGNSMPDSIATSIYQAWFMHLGPLIFEDDLNGDLYDSFARRRHATFLLNIISNPNNPWCDNILTVPKESCPDMAQQALEHALDDLTERLGKNITDWQWEKIHITQYPHNPFSEVPVLRYFFHREIPNGGDAYTINVAPPNYSKPYLQTHVVSYRAIYDLSDWNKSLFMQTTGQSGNPLSSHYDDLIEGHQAIKYLPMTFGRNFSDGALLLLEPN